VTVGPSLFKDNLLSKIHKSNFIYRINGAHGSIQAISKTIKDVHAAISNPVLLLDLPGNKVRTAQLEKGIAIESGKKFQLKPEQINYSKFHELLKKGDTVLANDSTFKFTVDEISGGVITFLSHSTGVLGPNKGMHLRGISDRLPFLFQKDSDLIQLANQEKVAFVGLSFVRTAADVREARALISPTIEIISKIETIRAVENINSILEQVDRILVDRGDLSTEVTIERVASFQRFIIERAHFFNKEVYLATQFLKNMEEKPIPTIAEVIDLYNTLKMGVMGIQLSEETAVGAYPAECLDVIDRVQRTIEQEALGGLDPS